MSSYVFYVSTILAVFGSTVKCNSCDDPKLSDPRTEFNVDLDNFRLNEDIKTKNVIEMITEGQGFDILSGLFEPEEVQHAKNTIHYLIQKQGSKATHFQVSKNSTRWRFIVFF